MRWKEQFEGGVLWEGYSKHQESWKEGLKGYLAGSLWEQQVQGVVVGWLKGLGGQAQVDFMKGRLLGSQGHLGLQANVMLTEWWQGDGVWEVCKEVLRIEARLGVMKVSWGCSQGLQGGLSWDGRKWGRMKACPWDAAQQLVSRAPTKLEEESEGKREKKRRLLALEMGPAENKKPKENAEPSVETVESEAKESKAPPQVQTSDPTSFSSVSTMESLHEPSRTGVENDFKAIFYRLAFVEKIYWLDKICLNRFLSNEDLKGILGPKEKRSNIFLNQNQKDYLKQKGFSETDIEKARIQQIDYWEEEKVEGVLKVLKLETPAHKSYRKPFIEGFSDTDLANQINQKIANYCPSTPEEIVCWDFFLNSVLKNSHFDTEEIGPGVVIPVLRTIASWEHANPEGRASIRLELFQAPRLLGTYFSR